MVTHEPDMAAYARRIVHFVDGRVESDRLADSAGGLMVWNAFLLALREIRRNMVRSFLTILGIVIGVAAVITMVTLGQGATRAVRRPDRQPRQQPAHDPARASASGRRAAWRGAPNFRIADAEAIAAQVSGLAAVAPSVSRGVTVVYGARNWSSSIVGTTLDYFTAGSWTLATGRYFNEFEERARRRGVRHRRDRAPRALRQDRSRRARRSASSSSPAR